MRENPLKKEKKRKEKRKNPITVMSLAELFDSYQLIRKV
jgi:hypothetical protein